MYMGSSFVLKKKSRPHKHYSQKNIFISSGRLTQCCIAEGGGKVTLNSQNGMSPPTDPNTFHTVPNHSLREATSSHSHKKFRIYFGRQIQLCCTTWAAQLFSLFTVNEVTPQVRRCVLEPKSPPGDGMLFPGILGENCREHCRDRSGILTRRRQRDSQRDEFTELHTDGECWKWYLGQ